MKKVDAIIIGGGVSGLLAARELQKQGKSFVVLERSDEVGGCIRSRTIQGYTVELGATTLVRTPAIMTLLEELDLLDNITEPACSPFQQYVWSERHQAPRAVPRSLSAFISTDLFSLSQKFRIALGLFKHTTVLPQDSVSSVFSKLIGVAPVRIALAPALRGIFGGDVSTLSAQAVFPRIAAALNNRHSLFSYMKNVAAKRKIFHIKGGNQLLATRLAAALTAHAADAVMCNASVTAVSKHEDIFRVTVTSSSSNTEADGSVCFFEAPELYMAHGGESLRSLLTQINNQTTSASDIPMLRYAPIVTVHCLVPSTSLLPPQGFGVLFPQESSAKIIGVLFNSQLFPHVAASDIQRGQSLLTVCLGGVTGTDVLAMSDQAIADTVKADLKKFLQLDDVAVIHTYRWSNAIPQFDSRFFDIQHQFNEEEGRHPGLKIIGVERGAIGVPDRIDAVLSAVHR